MDTVSLAGLWLFMLGSPEPALGQTSLPPAPAAFADTIELPGTTETRGKGALNEKHEPGMLTRVRHFDGPAWYRREVEIPDAWRGRRIELRLERTKYTELWFDDRAVGGQGIHTATQAHDLTAVATPGRHWLTLMVDNRPERRPVQGEAHQFSDNTQTNWNGVLGRIELVAFETVHLEHVQVFSDLAARTFRVRGRVNNTSGRPTTGVLSISARSFNHEGAPHVPPAVLKKLALTAEATAFELGLPLGEGARHWDEFSPALYELMVVLETPSGRDARAIETGLREFRTAGTHFAINGRTTFLRGKHEGCVFPLTGHPPTDLEGWLRHFRIVKEWGFNHVRCHTWVPPEAAFAAADRLGIYLQPELPFWGTFEAKVRDWLWPEGEAVLRAYGNHPSFVMFTLGNELGGDRALMNEMVERLRELDPRRLYADGSNNWLWEPRQQPTNDFFISAKVIPPGHPGKPLPVRGSFWIIDGRDGHVQWGPSETRTDLSRAIARVTVPVIGHEIGQWAVYPDFTELPKYAGVTRPRNLERFRGILAQRGMLDQAGDFQRASGALAAELYREENELALRTPGFGGFQYLDLQDFPGQGTALVGLLDAFMETKRIVAPAQFRRSCAPIVPLARFDRYTWTTDDTYAADLQVAHFGPRDLPATRTAWALLDARGAAVASGTLPAVHLAQGGLRALGRVEIPLRGLPAPARYDLRVTVLSGTAGEPLNSWPLWVYPASINVTPPEGVALVRDFDAAARTLLAAGKPVVLVPSGRNWARTVPGGYATDFWNWPMFNGSPGTMGLRCDPTHPALRRFPTAFHSERQWADIAHAATPVILTGTPSPWRPIVQVIDNYERNEKLGLVFEAGVGAGRLLVCAVDLLTPPLAGKPEARQLLASLLAYAAAPDFSPTHTLDPGTLESILRPSLAQDAAAQTSASSTFQPPWGFVPTAPHATDGDINTRWEADQGEAMPSLTIALGRPCAVDALEVVWQHDLPGYCYLVEGSASAAGESWVPLSDQRTNTFAGWRHVLLLPGQADQLLRRIRITITGWPEGRSAALREVRVLGQARR